VLRGFRALLWSTLVATAQAQFLPPVTRRSETAWPESETPTSPQAEITAAVPSPNSVFPQSTPNPPPAPAHDFAIDLFKYLEEPEPETQTPRDDSEPYTGLVISGGQVIGLTQDKHWFLGIGTDRLAWAGSGGFAAYGKDRTVIVHGDTYPLIWGTSKHFIGESDVFIFGAADSDATLIWHKKIDLGKEARTIRVIEGLEGNQRASVRFDQGFINGDLIFEGSDTLDWNSPHGARADLIAANSDWRGNLTVRNADLRANLGATLRGLDSITIEAGGRFAIDNLGTSSASTGGYYLANRLSQFTNINLNSGTFAYWGRDRGNSYDRTGIIDLLGGANVIDIVNHRPNQSTILTIGGLYRGNGATLNITNSRTNGGTLGSNKYTPQLKFHTKAAPEAIPSLEGGIIPWMTVNGTDFATLKGKHLVVYTDYNTGGESTWLPAHNVSPLADHQYLTTNRTVNSLRLAGGRSITFIGNASLTLNAGALLSTGHEPNRIDDGELVTRKSELFAHVFQGWLSIGSDIRQTFDSNKNGIGLVKTGDGTLILSGQNLSALRGNHYIHEGTLVLDRRGDGVGLGGHLFVGNSGRREAILELHQGAQLQHTASITLRGNRITDGIHPNHYNTRLTLYSVEQYLDSLTIEGASMLEFREYTSPDNLIGFDHILMADAKSELLIRGWDQFTKHLLIRRSSEAEIAQYLSQIKFVGHDATAKLIDYDSGYFEIVPTWFNSVPEPSTTGALLGTGALGFYAWRKRRVANK